jgi:hypothetical protein
LELYTLSAADKVKMLRKLALFWDGQWFLRSVEKFGLEEAVDLNAAVRTAFGRIEMRTMLKALGKKEADDLTDAVRMIATHSDLLLGRGVRAEYETHDRRARIVVRRCAAFEGAKRANLPRHDQSCVTCETLWDAWFRALLPDAEISVAYPQRQGMGDPVCEFVVVQRS